MIKWILLISMLITQSIAYNLSTNNNPENLNLNMIKQSFLPQTMNHNYTISENNIFPSIAFVKPIFTATAYSGFYSGFSTGASSKNGYYDYPKLDGTKYFDKLLVNTWSTSSEITNYINLLKNKYHNINIITDLDLHNGNVFDEDGSPKYSSLIFMHNEYVTLQEYKNLIRFIQSGGNAIILNGNAFFAEVDYDEKHNKVKLVSGHGWQFDGENGTKSDDYYRFYKSVGNFEHSTNFGSRYCAFNKGSTNGANINFNNTNPHPIAKKMYDIGITKVLPNYNSHEENCLITPNAHIIASWDVNFETKFRGIKIYEFFPHGYHGGSLIHFGFFGSNKMAYNSDIQQLFEFAVRHQANQYITPWIKYPMDNAVLKDDIILDYDSYWDTTVYLDGVIRNDIKKGINLDFLGDGTYNLTIEFQKFNIKEIKSVLFTIDTKKPKIFINNNEINEKQIITIQASTPYTVNISDYNVEDCTIRGYSEIREPIKHVYYDYNIKNQVMNYSNISLFFETKPHKGYYSITTLDSAGNTIINWLYVEGNENTNITRQYNPGYQTLNESRVRLSIPKVDNNILAKLQISTNFGIDWSNYELNHNMNYSYYDYKKETDTFWFRFAIKSNGITEYMHDIKSYQWDSDMISIKEVRKNNSIYEFKLSPNFKNYKMDLILEKTYYNNTIILKSNKNYNITDNGIKFLILNNSKIRFWDINMKFYSTISNFTLTKTIANNNFNQTVSNENIKIYSKNLNESNYNLLNNITNIILISQNNNIITLTKSLNITLWSFYNNFTITTYDRFGKILEIKNIEFKIELNELPVIEFSINNSFNIFQVENIILGHILNGTNFYCNIYLNDQLTSNEVIDNNKFELLIISSNIVDINSTYTILVELIFNNQILIVMNKIQVYFYYEDLTEISTVYTSNITNISQNSTKITTSTNVINTSTVNYVGNTIENLTSQIDSVSQESDLPFIHSITIFVCVLMISHLYRQKMEKY